MRLGKTGATMLMVRTRRRHLALILRAASLVAKGAGVIAYRVFHPPLLAKILTTYDPLGVAFADAALPLFFDLHGIALPPKAPVVYSALLVFAFGAQCMLFGLAIRVGYAASREAVPGPDLMLLRLLDETPSLHRKVALWAVIMKRCGSEFSNRF
jgi:hypothetical protein